MSAKLMTGRTFGTCSSLSYLIDLLDSDTPTDVRCSPRQGDLGCCHVIGGESSLLPSMAPRSNKSGQIRQKGQRVGASSLLGKVLKRLDRAVGAGIERVLVYRIVADDAVPNLSCPPELAVARLLPGQMSELKDVFSSVSMSELEGAQKKQSQCYGAWLSGRLVHYAWVQASGSHSILEAGRHVDIKPGEFWIYDCRTSTSVRGLGIYPYVLTFICHEHLRDRPGEGIIYTTQENVASQRGIVKAGFQMKETLRGLRIGSRYYPR
jgi:hypothetical protein